MIVSSETISKVLAKLKTAAPGILAALAALGFGFTVQLTVVALLALVLMVQHCRQPKLRLVC